MLGERLSDGSRLPRTPKELPPVPTKQEEVEAKPVRQYPEPRSYTDPRTDAEAKDMARYDFQFKKRPSPELISRATTLHTILMKRNLYQATEKAWGLPVAAPEPITESTEPEGDNRVTINDDQDDTLSVSSMPCLGGATALNRQCLSPVSEGESYETVSEPGRNSSMSHINGRRPDVTRHTGSRKKMSMVEDGDFMKQILVKKYRQPKPKRKPISDRINDFYGKVDLLREQKMTKEELLAGTLERWLELTKGLKAALAESPVENTGESSTSKPK